MGRGQRIRVVATATQNMLTVPQYAEAYGITERAAWMEIYRGKIPYHKQGRKVILFRDELEAHFRALPGVTVQEALANVRELAASGH